MVLKISVPNCCATLSYNSAPTAIPAPDPTIAPAAVPAPGVAATVPTPAPITVPIAELATSVNSFDISIKSPKLVLFLLSTTSFSPSSLVTIKLPF